MYLKKNIANDPPLEKNGRKLVWHDEFEKPNIDMKKWCFIRSMDRPGAVYDNSEKNVRIEDNKLLMQVHKCGDTYTLPEGFSTKFTMNFKYGYLEMRAKIPFKHAAWPSFWMKTDTPFRKKEVPQFAEIDIFEVFSSPDKVVHNLHKWKRPGLHVMLPGGEGNNSRAYTFENPENLNNEYHIYGLEWDEKFMKFYIDDNCYATVPIDESGNFGSDVIDGIEDFHDYAYPMMNNEYFSEGAWHPQGCVISDDDDLPFDYYIDWVRLYQNSDKESIRFEDEIKAAYERLTEK